MQYLVNILLKIPTNHSKGTLTTDKIECKVTGIKYPTRDKVQTTNVNQPDEIQQETSIKIKGCDSHDSANKIRNCLAYYGEILSEFTENTHYDPDPEAQPVCYGTHQIKMKLS